MRARLGMAFLAVPAFLAPPLAAQSVSSWIGRPAPVFSLPDLQGHPVRLAQFKGRVVVLHLTATWCPYCAAELKGLKALDEDFRAKGVQVLVVDVKEAKATVASAAERHGLAFPVLLDGSGRVARSYCPEGARPELQRDEVALASNLIVDAEGRIRYYSLFSTGAYDAKLTELRRELETLLAAP